MDPKQAQPKRPPKPETGFFKHKQTSITRKIIWHGSTAFLIGGFMWATYATFMNEQQWKSELRKYSKEFV